MAQTAIEIPEYVTVVKPASISDLARIASLLLAEHDDLPAPRYFHVSQGGQDIRLGFGDDPASFRTLALWAERFGGTVTAEPYTRDDGRKSIYTEVKFICEGTDIEAHAFVTAPDTTQEAATATT